MYNWKSSKIFTDGSCSKSDWYRPLWRGGWAIIILDEDDESIKAACYGPCWRGLPQTSAAAEVCALAVLSQLIDGERVCGEEITAYSDYKAAVYCWSNRGRACLPTKAYAGIYRVAVSKPGIEHLKVQWTKGHSTQEGWQQKGNNWADEYADKGRDMHDFCGIYDKKKIEEPFRLQFKYLLHVAKNLAIWAEQDQGQIDWKIKVKALAKPHRQVNDTSGAPHLWQWERGVHRCWHCYRQAFNLTTRAKQDKIACGGPQAHWRKLNEKAMELKHDLIIFTQSKWELVGCSHCGCTSQYKAFRLAQKCQGHFTCDAQKRFWEKLTKTGRHPITKQVVGEGVPLLRAAREAVFQFQAGFLEESSDEGA